MENANVTREVDAEKGVTVFTVTGKIRPGDIAEALKRFYSEHVTSNVIWDFSRCDLTEIVSADVDQLVRTACGYADKRSDGKTAIVGAGGLTFGLIRMYELIFETQNAGFEAQSFLHVDDAYQWLLEE